MMNGFASARWRSPFSGQREAWFARAGQRRGVTDWTPPPAAIDRCPQKCNGSVTLCAGTNKPSIGPKCMPSALRILILNDDEQGLILLQHAVAREFPGAEILSYSGAEDA